MVLEENTVQWGDRRVNNEQSSKVTGVIKGNNNESFCKEQQPGKGSRRRERFKLTLKGH